MIKNIVAAVTGFFRDYDRIQRHSSTGIIEWEVRELENIFALILFGFVAGHPSAPMHITLDLLPYMERDLDIILERVSTAHDPLGELFSILEIG